MGTTTADKKFLTQLMNDRAQIEAALAAGANPKLQRKWGDFMAHATKAKTLAEQPTPIKRLSQKDKSVPGFDGADGNVAIRVLVPFEIPINNAAALHNFSSSPDKNTNGNSLLLRLDYGRARILLTGDLNSDSQRALLTDYIGNRREFQCDVAKACQHGSDDVSYEFLSAMRPAVTVISPGDEEGHDHPRPAIAAASATTGYLEIKNDGIVTPLVYSTELARSFSMGRITRVTVDDPAGTKVVPQDNLQSVAVEAKVMKAGDLNPQSAHGPRPFQRYRNNKAKLPD